MAMEFLAATKEGIIVMDMMDRKPAAENQEGNWETGTCADGQQVKVVAKLPSPPNAFGHAWSNDGRYLASVCDEGIRVYDADNKYSTVIELEKVAPDVGGRAGGVRNCRFSSHNNFLVTYEKWDPQYPENVHVWVLSGDRAGQRQMSCILKGYTSGALPVEIITWTSDEKTCLELAPGRGIILRDGDLQQVEEDEDKQKVIAEKNAGHFVVSPRPHPQKGGHYIAVFTPESPSGMVARVSLYHLDNPTKPSLEFHLPAKVKDTKIVWNADGTALLVLANSDVDESGASYFGTTYLYWMRTDSKAQTLIYGSKDGQVQDIAWSPTANEFLVIVGFQPATVALHSGMTGKLTSTLGQSRRNTLKYNPFGRLVAVGGFGTLAGDLDFFDRSKEETVSSLRAALTVECNWAPDGRHFLCATIAPRMNEGNQVTIYRYSGEQILNINYKPDHIEARHEDTGAGARTKTQALLFWASWRPHTAGQYEDRPASPPRAGQKRQKGLPSSVASAGPQSSTAGAYRPRGEGSGGSLVAAMMRGEIDVPTGTTDGERWQVNEAKPLEEWEIRKLEKQRKKEQEEKEKAEKEAVAQAIKDLEQAEKDKKKKLKALKEKLASLDELKEKAWDELTEEDEEAIDDEVNIRQQISDLEKELRISS